MLLRECPPTARSKAPPIPSALAVATAAGSFRTTTQPVGLLPEQFLEQSRLVRRRSSADVVADVEQGHREAVRANGVRNRRGGVRKVETNFPAFLPHHVRKSLRLALRETPDLRPRPRLPMDRYTARRCTDIRPQRSPPEFPVVSPVRCWPPVMDRNGSAEVF